MYGEDRGWEPRRIGHVGVREAGGERAGSRSSKRARNGREMQNAIFFLSLLY